MHVAFWVDNGTMATVRALQPSHMLPFTRLYPRYDRPTDLGAAIAASETVPTRLVATVRLVYVVMPLVDHSHSASI